MLSMDSVIFMSFALSSQMIGFIYGLIIEQFGWTVYIVLGGFAVSCLVRSFYIVVFAFDPSGY